MQMHHSRILPLAILALMAGALPASAFTPMDAANLFGTNEGDGFTSIFLNQIFGPIFPSVAGGTSETVFSVIIGYFNIIMLVIGGMMLFYNATVGLLQSAHEGSVLGQRWSSLWAPLRVIFAVGLLVPVPGLGGYNLVQAGVAYVVKGSTNIASAVWTTSANLVVSGQVAVSSANPVIPPAVIRILYQNAACEAIVNHQMALAAGGTAAPFQIGSISENHDDGSGSSVQRRTVTSTLRADGVDTREGICGTYSTPDTPIYITRISNDTSVIQGVQDGQRDAISETFADMHDQVLQDTMGSLRTLTAGMLPAVLDNGQQLPSITNDIGTIHSHAHDLLSTGTANISDIALGADRQGQDARDALLARITGDCIPTEDDATVTRCYGEGWIGAGSWYMMIAQLNNEMASLSNAVPSATPGNYIRSSNSVNREIHIASGGSRWGYMRNGSDTMMDDTGISLAMDRYMSSFDQSVGGLAALGYEISSDHLNRLAEDNATTAFDFRVPGLTSYIENFRNNIIGYFSPGNRSTNADPMIGMSVLGQYLIALSGVLMIGAVGLGYLSGGAVAIALLPIIIALVTAGSTLALLLPIMPFIFWVLAVTGYFLLVVEAMIAVNLWALAHMRLDGDGISGEAGRNGWLMLLAILMTPVLMVFGFLIGMTIFRVTSALLDIGMYQALSGILGGNIFINLVAIATYTIFMAIFYMILLERSFSLVSEFPGRVLRWMGAGAQLTNGEEGKVRMAAAGAALAVSKGSGIAGTPFIRGAGAAGLSRGGAYGNPQGDPERFGASRRGLSNMDTTAGEGEGRFRRSIKATGRGLQRITGTQSASARPGSGSGGDEPPKASG